MSDQGSTRRFRFFMASSVSGILVVGLLCFTGCKSCEHLETALRMREEDLLLLREDLLRLEFQNQALKQQIAALQASSAASPSQASAPKVRLERLTLGQTTGGYDIDGRPGDDALQVVIQPRDQDNNIVPIAGAATITALEIGKEGTKTSIGTWAVSQQQMAETWKNGLFTQGYALLLPWQKKPTKERLRVVVRFRSPDGREFEVDRDVSLRLPPEQPPSHHTEPQAVEEGPILEPASHRRFRLHTPVALDENPAP